MRLPDRKEIEVRRLLEAQPRPLPADLADRALAQGNRMLRRRHAVLVAAWAVLVSALLVLAVWVAVAEPWDPPPPDTTPTIGW